MKKVFIAHSREDFLKQVKEWIKDNISETFNYQTIEAILEITK